MDAPDQELNARQIAFNEAHAEWAAINPAYGPKKLTERESQIALDAGAAMWNAALDWAETNATVDKIKF